MSEHGYLNESSGTIGQRCFGLRVCIDLNDGVYIASGDGTEGNEYVLAME